MLWKIRSECRGEMIENLVLDVELHRDMLLTMTQGHSQNNVTIDSKSLDEDSIKPPAKSIIQVLSSDNQEEEDKNIDGSLSGCKAP